MMYLRILILSMLCSVQLYAQDSLLQYSLMPGSKDRLLHYTQTHPLNRTPEQLKEFLTKYYPFRTLSITTVSGQLTFTFADTLLMTNNEIPTQFNFSCTITFDNPALFDFYMIYYQGLKHDGTPWLTTAEEAFPDDLLFNKKGKPDKLRAEYKIKTLVRFNNLISILSGSIDE